ncbi:MAG: hypothetical protein QOE55_4813 [Acidobacteriaceae bacterium]|nr:hypothetical protein [Acidobacteriaceae bacterium]
MITRLPAIWAIVSPSGFFPGVTFGRSRTTSTTMPAAAAVISAP